MSLNKRYRELNKALKPLSSDERLMMNMYLMSGVGPLPEGSNLDDVFSFLLKQDPKTIPELVEDAKIYVEAYQVIPYVPPEANENKTINFSLQLPPELDPKTVFIVSRDISNSEEEKLVLQELNLDGDYIPLSVDQVAATLKQYADVMVERQQTINSNDV